jgi:hypothetical protein
MRELFLSREFLVGLIHDAIGILVTVFIVDRLIARHERKRGLPARQVLWAEITDLMEHLMTYVLPSAYSNQIDPKHLEFGAAGVWVLTEIRSGTINEITSQVKQKLAKEQDVYKEITEENEVLISVPSADKLRAAQDRIDAVMVRYSTLLDPEPTNYLLKIRRELDNALLLRRTNSEWIAFGAPLNDIAIYLSELYSWLRLQADKEVTLTDQIEQMKEQKAVREKK